MRFALLLAGSLTFSGAFAAEEQLSPYQWQQQQKVAFDASENITNADARRSKRARQ